MIRKAMLSALLALGLAGCTSHAAAPKPMPCKCVDVGRGIYVNHCECATMTCVVGSSGGVYCQDKRLAPEASR